MLQQLPQILESAVKRAWEKTRGQQGNKSHSSICKEQQHGSWIKWRSFFSRFITQSVWFCFIGNCHWFLDVANCLGKQLGRSKGTSVVTCPCDWCLMEVEDLLCCRVDGRSKCRASAFESALTTLQSKAVCGREAASCFSLKVCVASFRDTVRKNSFYVIFCFCLACL